MMLRLVIFFGVVAVLAISADRPPDSNAKEKALSVCDILLDPMKYDGQRIAIRGTSEGTDEGWWIGAGKTCAVPLVTFGYTWPSIIWIKAVAPEFQRAHHLDFRTDYKALDRVDRQVDRMHFTFTVDRLWLTYTGIFETRKYSAKDVGTTRAFGFGHLATAPGQLLLKTTSDPCVEHGALRK